MTPALSAHLELVRVLATLLVFLAHSLSLYQPWAAWAEQVHLGRDGVVVFFVLSGYVISWCADRKEPSLRAFVVHRAARIYSVALFGIALGILASLAVAATKGNWADFYQFRKPWLYLPIYLSFTGGHWTLTENPPNNFPYWSLNCEVWYYILFAIVFYARTSWRWVAAAAVAITVGPQTMALAPLWLMGAGAYFLRDRWKGGPAASLWVLLLTTIGYLGSKLLGIDDRLDSWGLPLWQGFFPGDAPPNQLFGDYWLGALVTLHLVAAQRAVPRMPTVMEAGIRWLASHSFSFYLYHIPLFTILSLVWTDRGSMSAYASILATSTVAILVLARFSEHRKDVFRHAFERLATALGMSTAPIRQGS